MAMIIDKAALLGAAARKEEMVPVQGGEIRVVELGAAEYLRMLDACHAELGKESIITVVGSWSCVDDKDERLFTVEEFKRLNRETQFALGGVAMKYNWMSGDEKNAEAGQESDLPSGSL